MRRCAFDGVMGPNIPNLRTRKGEKKGVYYSLFFWEDLLRVTSLDAL